MLKDKKKAIIASLLAMVLWGSAIPTIKNTYLEMNVTSADMGAQILIAGIRFFMAGVLGLIYMKVLTNRKVRKDEINGKYIFVLSLLQTSVQYMLYYIALANTAGVKASIIQSTNSFIVIILSLILLPNEKINIKTVIAILLGTLGIVVVNGGIANISEEFNLMGDGLLLLSITTNALSAIFVRKYGRNQDEFFTTAAQFILGSIPLIILGLILNDIPLVFTPKALALLAYGAFISATAYVIWNSVMKYHSPNEMSMYKLFIPIFGSIFSIIFLNESFTSRLMLGLILVLAGSIVLNIEMPNKKIRSEEI